MPVCCAHNPALIFIVGDARKPVMLGREAPRIPAHRSVGMGCWDMRYGAGGAKGVNNPYRSTIFRHNLIFLPGEYCNVYATVCVHYRHCWNMLHDPCIYRLFIFRTLYKTRNTISNAYFAFRLAYIHTRNIFKTLQRFHILNRVR